MSSVDSVRVQIIETVFGLKYSYPSFGYPGGKKRVADKIIARMPAHNVYVEPFAGAAHVFFKKPKARKNVLNDINRELIGFFKDIKGREVCCDIKDSRREFERRREKSNKNICDYVYINKTAFGGKDTFGGRPTYANRKKKIDRKICITGEKLKNVVLSTRDYRKVIEKYDSKDTLFYVDPPYVEANKKECLYGKGKCAITPIDVANSLRNIKGKAIISYDNHPDVRRAFKGFRIGKIDLPYSLSRRNGRLKGKTGELLIKNF